MQKGLAFLKKPWYIIVVGCETQRTKQKIRVWRSLVSRLNGVQEAAGSSPVTRTKRKSKDFLFLFFSRSLESAASCYFKFGRFAAALHIPPTFELQRIWRRKYLHLKNGYKSVTITLSSRDNTETGGQQDVFL